MNLERNADTASLLLVDTVFVGPMTGLSSEFRLFIAMPRRHAVVPPHRKLLIVTI